MGKQIFMQHSSFTKKKNIYFLHGHNENPHTIYKCSQSAMAAIFLCFPFSCLITALSYILHFHAPGVSVARFAFKDEWLRTTLFFFCLPTGLIFIQIGYQGIIYMKDPSTAQFINFNISTSVFQMIT